MKKVIIFLSVMFSVAILTGCAYVLCSNGHSFGEWCYTDPTCTEPGEKGRKCKLCGYIETVELPPIGHYYMNPVVTLEPTCTEVGSRYTTCAYCGDIKVEEIPASHSWDEGVITTEPTCKTVGVKTYTCTACNETKTEEVATLSHSKYSIKCPSCGEWFITQNFVGTAAKDGDGLDITVTEWTKTIGENYDMYYLSYTIVNNVPDSKLLPGTFDIIMEDGTSESQYGAFNYIYTGDSSSRSYSWKILHTQKPLVLMYSNIFSSNQTCLYWDVPQEE